MRRLFETYQYVAPAVLTPLGAWLWWRHYDGVVALAAIALMVPIAHAYLVPGVGTNILKVWEFDTRLRLGRFRPHHGFVFGSATAMLALLTVGPPSPQLLPSEVARSALLTGLLLGGINWLYDVAAIRAGILRVYNQPWANRKQPTAIVNDYAPWFFGGFGLVYGAGLKVAESLLMGKPGVVPAMMTGLLLLAATVTVPTLGYVIQSYVRHGHHGCRPIGPRAGE
jgi:hypothetical protein